MTAFYRRSLCISLGFLACVGLLACSHLDQAETMVANVVSPYRMDIVQGNVVTREQVAAIKPGMVRNQVRDIMGTALLTSVFHANRWDYVFTLDRRGNEVVTRHVTVFFTGNAVDRVESDELPSEAEFAATLKSKPVEDARKLPALDASPEALARFPAAAKPAPAPLVLAPASTSYPPLEPAAP